MSYRDYLGSDSWRDAREPAIARSRGTCEMCGATGTQVHHVRYPKRRGEEHPDSLLMVCDACHRKMHGIREIATMVEFDKRTVRTLGGAEMAVAVTHTPEPNVYARIETMVSAMSVPDGSRRWFVLNVPRAADNLLSERNDVAWRAYIADHEMFHIQAFIDTIAGFVASKEKYRGLRVAPIGEVDDFSFYQRARALQIWMGQLVSEALAAEIDAKPHTPAAAMAQAIADAIEPRFAELERRIALVEEAPPQQAALPAPTMCTVMTRCSYWSLELDRAAHTKIGKRCRQIVLGRGLDPDELPKLYTGDTPKRQWPMDVIDEAMTDLGYLST